jgi:hypothetical protein
LIECPLCFFSTKADSALCVHCHRTIPLFVKVYQSGATMEDNVLEMVWPPKNELLAGSIKTLPPNYVNDIAIIFFWNVFKL